MYRKPKVKYAWNGCKVNDKSTKPTKLELENMRRNLAGLKPI